MKVVFMGTPEFAVPTLQALIDHHQVIGVVTQPDKQRGRGKKVQFPPVKEKAVEYDLPVYQPVKAREEEFVSVLRDLNPDVIVVVAYGQILPESILNIPKYGCINVHGSLLPKYRGAAPIQWSVLDGEEKTGITTMYMEKGLDTGDMIDKVELTLDPKETAGSLHDKLMVMGADLLLETLEKLENGTAVRTKQDDSLSCYAKMLTKDMGQVDFSKSAVEIERLIRGLNPWPSAYTSMDGKTMKLWDADATPYDGDAEPGTIVDVTKEAIVAATGEGALALKEIQLAGKKRMKVSAFLLGYHVETGTKLGE
ncbi:MULTISPECIES: methionyl-tRNA formyltransferase [Anaerostipes]|uniref:methionyl-tRNA formyltransferase n=1 Tax=Anaerostipes TaxID=207244 RepID=UPI0025882DC2|nr:methionyl-tRNA formyltransferase [Anaerostipes sp.]MCI5622373.1 methionyl-tRNA formyltransferase [Anaerostipes sp.]MDY2727257.1 methionyl-tRNA formyltransferase [Anaerostipes faecalis]